MRFSVQANLREAYVKAIIRQSLKPLSLFFHQPTHIQQSWVISGLLGQYYRDLLKDGAKLYRRST